MIISTAEAVPTTPKGSRTDSGADKPTTRARRPHSNRDEEASSFTRYFLAKEPSDGKTPALGREMGSEGEALVEALRSGVTYYAIQEFRVIPDFAGRRPQLQKEAIPRK